MIFKYFIPMCNRKYTFIAGGYLKISHLNAVTMGKLYQTGTWTLLKVKQVFKLFLTKSGNTQKRVDNLTTFYLIDASKYRKFYSTVAT